MRRTLVAGCVLGVFSAAVPRTALALGSDAESLFREGREAIVAGQTARGCALLAESDRLEPSPGARLGRGLCEEQLGHAAAAWGLLRQVVRMLPAEDERVAIAERHADELERKLAFVSVELTGPRLMGTRVTTDLAELTSAELGVPLPFDPGQHFFQLSGPGVLSHRVDVVLQAGERRTIALAVTPEPAREAAPKTAPPRLPQAALRPPAAAPSTAQYVGVGLEGAAGALLVTSLSAGFFALAEKRHVERSCDANDCSPAGDHARGAGAALTTLSSVTFVAALATGAVGAVLLIVGRPAAAQQVSSRRTLGFHF